MDCLIFSKDRPMQLHLLLESHKINCGFFKSIFVLYHASNHRTQQGYDQLQKDWPGIRLVRENNFETQTKSIIRRSNSDVVTLLCDDVVFHRNIKDKQEDILSCIRRDEIFSFTFGLGAEHNLQRCHPPSYQTTCVYRNWFCLNVELATS